MSPVQLAKSSSRLSTKVARSASPSCPPRAGPSVLRHPVEVAADRGGVEVVEHRPVGAGGPALHEGVALLQDPDVQDLASGRLDADRPVGPDDAGSVAELGPRLEAREPLGHEAQEGEAGLDVDLVAVLLLLGGELGESSLEGAGIGQGHLHHPHPLGPVGPLEESSTERPARAHDEVRGHVPLAGPGGGGPHDLVPLRAEPLQAPHVRRASRGSTARASGWC